MIAKICGALNYEADVSLRVLYLLRYSVLSVMAGSWHSYDPHLIAGGT